MVAPGEAGLPETASRAITDGGSTAATLAVLLAGVVLILILQFLFLSVVVLCGSKRASARAFALMGEQVRMVCAIRGKQPLPKNERRFR